MDEYKKLLSPKTKMVALVHISNALGTINPVKEVTRLAHEVGAKVLIDGDIPAELEGKARRAEANCPERAIIISE